MKRRLSRVALFVAACCGLTVGSEVAVQCDEPTQESRSESIFDGRELSGWKHGSNWTVENGEVVCRDRGENLAYRAAKIPDKFELQFEWKSAKHEKDDISPQSGAMPDGLFSLTYRAIPVTDLTHGRNKLSNSGEIAFGYSTSGGRVIVATDAIPLSEAANATGSLFYTVTPDKNVSRPAGQWNTGRIVWKAGVVQHWLNGEKVVDINLDSVLKTKENERLRDLTAKL